MLSTLNDIKKGLALNIDGAPCIVMEAHFVRMQQRKPVMQTKLKNLSTGKTVEINFHPGDRVEEADLTRRSANFLYEDAENGYFMDNETFEQIGVRLTDITGAEFLKDGLTVTVLYFEDSPVSVTLPPKVDLRVAAAPEAIKGNTASGNVTKEAELENGARVRVPLFIKEGDTVRINTELGEYVERVNG